MSDAAQKVLSLADHYWGSYVGGKGGTKPVKAICLSN